MSKIVLVSFATCLLSCYVLGSPAEATSNNSIDLNGNSTPEAPVDFKPAHAMIAAIYKRAMVQALHTKVSELQEKLSTGENAIPAAIDILKITLLSTPTQNTIRKAAEHVFSLMSPDVKALAPQAMAEVSTTPIPKSDAEKSTKPTPKSI
jgi:hypothetical protein